jgi:hypothetical protein
VGDFSKAIELKPDFVYGYYNRVLAGYKIGNKQKSASDFKAACEMGAEKACRQYGIVVNQQV